MTAPCTMLMVGGLGQRMYRQVSASASSQPTFGAAADRIQIFPPPRKTAHATSGRLQTVVRLSSTVDCKFATLYSNSRSASES